MLLTTGKIAKICEVAPRTVGKWCDTGVLKSFRLPHSKDRRVHIDDFNSFLRDNGMEILIESEYSELNISNGSICRPDGTTINLFGNNFHVTESGRILGWEELCS